MAKHERIEELCAAASIGQASGAELAELHEHLAECEDCRQAYADFLQFSSVGYAASLSESKVTREEALGYIDSSQFREQFLQRAEAEGVVFSCARTALPPSPAAHSVHRIGWNERLTLATAAALLLAAGLAAGYYLRPPAGAGSDPSTASSPGVSQAEVPGSNVEAIVAHLRADNRTLSTEIASLRSVVSADSATLAAFKAGAVASQKQLEILASDLQTRDERIDQLQRESEQRGADLARIKAESESLVASQTSSLAAADAKIRALSNELDEQSASAAREREMLSADRDIRELMAARNLHIADVFDTDAKGRTRHAFGRVFFTEGKSLLFYAYDLNDRRVQNAGYNYRVWGKKEGPKEDARNLGIFYVDDKAQKRWVFKCDDPKVLNEIDSVFVTLEPPGQDPREPKGEKFLYAYLRNQPNHP